MGGEGPRWEGQRGSVSASRRQTGSRGPSWPAAGWHTWLNRDNGGCPSSPASFPQAEPGSVSVRNLPQSPAGRQPEGSTRGLPREGSTAPCELAGGHGGRGAGGRGPSLGMKCKEWGVGRGQPSTWPSGLSDKLLLRAPGRQHRLLPPSLSQGPTLENLLPCSGETKAPCSSPQSSGGPNPFWPSRPTIGSTLVISNWVCDAGPVSSAPGAQMRMRERRQRPRAPESASTSWSLKPSESLPDPVLCHPGLGLAGVSQDLSEQVT